MSSIGGVSNLVSSAQSGSTSSSPVATVQVGETQLSQVAQRVGVSADDLAAANPHISDPAKLTAGQDIVLPQNTAAPVASLQTAGNSAAGSLPQAPLGDPLTKSFIQADLASKSQLSEPGAQGGGVENHKDWVSVASFDHNVSDPAIKGAAGPVADPKAQPGSHAQEAKSKFDAFANFGDIKGESQDSNHKDWIEILSYDHGTDPTSKK